MIGLFSGLTCNYWHSTLEWSLKQNNNFAGQMIMFALIGVIAVHRKSIASAYKRSLDPNNAPTSTPAPEIPAGGIPLPAPKQESIPAFEDPQTMDPLPEKA